MNDFKEQHAFPKKKNKRIKWNEFDTSYSVQTAMDKDYKRIHSYSLIFSGSKKKV
jgi:hypothetical protein